MGMEEANGHQLSGQTGERYLYHFTSRWNFQGILAAGKILPGDPALTEANWGPQGCWRYATTAPDVVYLSSSREPYGNGLGELDAEQAVLPKREVRITLAWPHDAHRFQSWCEDKEKDQAWLDKLAKGNRPDLWYLVERAISWQEWLLVEDLEEPKVIWRPADSCIPYLTARQIDDVKGALGQDLAARNQVRSVAELAAMLGFVARED
jgi:hypothetical protein